MIRFTTKYSRT